MNTVEGRLGDTAEEAGGQGAGRGLAHVGVAVADRQEENAGRGAEAGEVPRAHGALDEVRTRRDDVSQLQGVERPVQAEGHQEGVDDRDDDREDDGSVAVEPGQAAAQAVTDQIDRGPMRKAVSGMMMMKEKKGTNTIWTFAGIIRFRNL